MVDTDIDGADEYDCQDGYVCNEGESTSIGTEPCYKDHWCASGEVTICNDGTYTIGLGIVSQTECLICPPGSVCPDNSNDIYECPAGYYCQKGIYEESTATHPIDYVICPVGSYCPSGSGFHILCEAGTYQDETEKSYCKDCPEGYYCDGNGVSAPVECSTDADY